MHDWTCYTSRAEFYIVEDANEDYARISGLNKTCRVIYNEFMPWLARNTYTSVRILSCKCQDASCRIDKTVPSIFRNAIQTIKVEFRINGDTNGSIDPGSMVSASFPSLERLYMTSKVAELQPILRSVDKRWCVKSLKDKSVLTELARNGLDDLKSIQDDYPPKDERNYRLDIAVPWGWYRAGSSAVAEDFEGFTLVRAEVFSSSIAWLKLVSQRTRHIEIEDGSVEFQYQIGDAMQEYDAVIERTGYESWLVWHDEYRMRGHFNSGTHPRGSAVYYNATPWVREQFSDK